MKKNKYCVSWLVDLRAPDEDHYFSSNDKIICKHEIFEKYTDAVKKHTEIKNKGKDDETICCLCLFKITSFYDKKGVMLSKIHTRYEKKDEFYKVMFGY